MTRGLIAVGQMTSSTDIEANFSVCQLLVQEAKERGARLLSLPECFAFLGESDTDLLGFMRHLDDELVLRYRHLARDHQLWLSLGGLQEFASDEPRAFNTHLLIDDNGEIQSTYRKLHLFDVDLPDGTKLHESRATQGGDEMVVSPSPLGNLGLSICYDLRFPELFLGLRKRGAEVLLIPAAFTATTGKAHWETLLRARAIETQCYVAAAAQVGRHNQKRESHGNAMIIDPWGAVVARCGEGVGIAVAPVDPGYLNDVRRRIPVMAHRRPKVYGDVGAP